jgi:hypothetical protein
MLRRVWTGFVAGLALACTLACGGEWNAAMSGAMNDQVDALVGKVNGVRADPSRAAMLAVLEQVRVDVAAGNIGLVELSTFQVTVEATLADGEISGAEVAQVQAEYDRIKAP